MNFSLKLIRIAALCGLLVLAVETAPARVLDGGSIMDQRMHENLCAITFDDGPSRNTPQLLDLLDQYGIPATFFLLGKQAELHPDLVRRIVAEGHEVGNHSFSHPNLRLLPPERKIEEIRRTDAILRSLGAAPLFLRPPYGAFDRHTVDAAEALGLSVVLWSVDSRDWQRLPRITPSCAIPAAMPIPPVCCAASFCFMTRTKAQWRICPGLSENCVPEAASVL